ncbi:hypothetical protein EUGRSUZ_B02895 [Eucalyptus grandis]|uniref:Uncharacterized protein n=2 Tax=Eucalyptus grandis TaxID=71139 RepID=A0ACC3LVF2_EUCGR|nr:hypothetical protein EUGRSUZ_B02895 [Eucalyptus grandis]
MIKGGRSCIKLLTLLKCSINSFSKQKGFPDSGLIGTRNYGSSYSAVFMMLGFLGGGGRKEEMGQKWY